MALTNNQLREIDAFLKIKRVYHVDIKHELKDHLVSEVEAKITKSNFCFESAFAKTQKEWEEELKLTSSLWIGSSVYLPKIIITKLITTQKQIVLKHLELGILFSGFLWYIINNRDIIGIDDSVLGFILGVCLGIYFSNIIYYYRIRKSLLRTTYGTLLKINSSAFLIIGLNLLGTYPASLTSGDLFFKILLFTNLLLLSLSTLMNNKLYKKHISELKKIKYVTF
jgi:hypothetical protein